MPCVVFDVASLVVCINTLELTHTHTHTHTDTHTHTTIHNLFFQCCIHTSLLGSEGLGAVGFGAVVVPPDCVACFTVYVRRSKGLTML